MKSLMCLLVICAVVIVGSCSQEPETAINVKFDGKVPPTFSFSGPWWASEFLVLEMPPRKENRSAGHDFSKDKKIWSVEDPHPPASAARWPHITYGVIPEKFRQMVPDDGKPPELTEGKTYCAQAIDPIGNGGLIYFTIHNGNSIEIGPSEVYYDR